MNNENEMNNLPFVFQVYLILLLMPTIALSQQDKGKQADKADFTEFRPILSPLSPTPPKFFHGPKFPKQNCTVLVKID
jgi:hypothetical protein